MDTVVLKFGGTSVDNIDKRKKIVEIVKECLNNKDFPILVVSAMGRYPSPYATDTLISLVNEEYQKNKQAMDELISLGEVISANIIAATLKENGLDATSLTGGQAGIITDNKFGNAKLIKYNDKYIKKLIINNQIPVVTGFQGITKDGFITTLGRGGSDTSATIIGSYLNSKEIIIYTDVDGIMTNDPKIDCNAHIISDLTYDEAYEMAINGAKVINPDAILYAKKKQVPIRIKGLYGTTNGTIIK